MTGVIFLDFMAHSVTLLKKGEKGSKKDAEKGDPIDKLAGVEIAKKTRMVTKHSGSSLGRVTPLQGYSWMLK
jgi:hypothetical protein